MLGNASVPRQGRGAYFLAITASFRFPDRDADRPCLRTELERQVERGSLFTHTALTEQAARANENEAIVNGLVDVLVRHHLVDADELLEAIDSARAETADEGGPRRSASPSAWTASHAPPSRWTARRACPSARRPAAGCASR